MGRAIDHKIFRNNLSVESSGGSVTALPLFYDKMFAPGLPLPETRVILEGTNKAPMTADWRWEVVMDRDKSERRKSPRTNANIVIRYQILEESQDYDLEEKMRGQLAGFVDKPAA